MNIKIMSDSTCDLPAFLLEQHNISLTPLIVMKDNEEYYDGGTITPADIFAHVAAGGSLCSTAARSVGFYEEEFAKYAKDYDGIIHISLGSQLSSSFQNAHLAAEEFDNVRVIDSQNLSSGQGLVVLKACELAKTATDLDALKAELDAFTEKVESSFVVDKLDYLVKGGRCSAAAALGANLLNLKPCIEVRGGKLEVVKKYRGNYVKCLTSYVKDRLENRENLDNGTIFLTKTVISDECHAALKDAVTTYGNFENFYESDAGCTISCHCGPGTAGILFVRK